MLTEFVLLTHYFNTSWDQKKLSKFLLNNDQISIWLFLLNFRDIYTLPSRQSGGGEEGQ